MQRVGLYGGSLDPVHLGHLLVAQAALDELRLDELRFIPAAQSPFKARPPVASAGVRIRMLRLALAGQERIEIDEREIRRGGVGYTIDTVREISGESPGTSWFWLIGADHVPELPQWRDSVELARLVEFVVIPRPAENIPQLPAPWRLQVLRGWPLRLSSSEIRERIRTGRGISHLVPAPVAEVIASLRLYEEKAHS
jgi:nicotinate-nucleotide adenylyltransferase